MQLDSELFAELAVIFRAGDQFIMVEVKLVYCSFFPCRAENYMILASGDWIIYLIRAP
jgi:deoxycytidylate deaminase